MDNPQHYQPLSHALNPPVGGPSRTQAQSQTQFSVYPTATNGVNPQEEEEEEDDDEEGLVEEQLNDSRMQAGSNPSSPIPPSASATETQNAQPSQRSSEPPEKKRRPGRPRGSKNRKPRGSGSEVPGKQPIAGFFSYPSQTLHSAGPGSAPPALPDVNAQNQQYYEFQWRVLNLCAEFYGAAEELVKSTTPLVVAQCYQMGPGSKVDPIMMLNEAKRNCDSLLANPTRLIANPPPPLFPTIPNFNQHPVPQPSPAASSGKNNASQASVITNPQSFVVSLGAGAQPPPAPPPTQTQFSAMYPQYPTTPYYQYPPYHGYYPAPPVAPPPAPTQPTPVPTIPAAAPGIHQGSWSDEETERLKKLAEESRTVNPSSNGEIEWDWVVHQWGNGRTRHQILIKATSMGLKESSSRGTKRRRESESVAPAEGAPAPASAAQAPVATPSSAPAANATNSTASPPAQSPALTHQQPSSTAATTGSNSSSAVPLTPKPNHPWPMPTVAATTPSPVITSAGVEPQKVSYYRPRPHEGRDAGASSSSKPNSKAGQGQGPTIHHYMFQNNGRKES